jgi:hypothetical protein
VQETGKRDRAVVFVLANAQHTPVTDAADDSKENASCPATM